jgi:aldehyde:ferredoxin oxidoreductase
LEELLRVGERRINMLRAFNAREGIDRKADSLPPKLFVPLTGEGPTAGVALEHAEVEAAKEEYYRLAGWDAASGNPTPTTLRRLGLEWV